MISWLRQRRGTAERIDVEADVLIGELGAEAYAEARRREYESSDDAIALRCRSCAQPPDREHAAKATRFQAHRARYLNSAGHECCFRASLNLSGRPMS